LRFVSEFHKIRESCRLTQQVYKLSVQQLLSTESVNCITHWAVIIRLRREMQ